MMVKITQQNENSQAGRPHHHSLLSRLAPLLLLFPVVAYASGDCGEIKSTIRSVAVKNKINPAHLLAMAEVESNFNPKAVGDGGRSHGCFQIQTKLHGITIRQAQDVHFAAQWACDYLNGYCKYRRNNRKGIARYNGGGDAAKRYAEKVLKISEKYKEGK